MVKITGLLEIYTLVCCQFKLLALLDLFALTNMQN